MLNEKFWLAIAFLSFVLLVLKYVRPLIVKALDDKSQQIAADILAAKEMREKAVILLQKAEKQYEESVSRAAKLLKDTEIESQKLRDEFQHAVEQEVNRKTAAALARIRIEEESTIRQVKTKIIASAIDYLTKNISKELSSADHKNLLARAAQDFEKTIH